jgi:hypothetical protein
MGSSLFSMSGYQISPAEHQDADKRLGTGIKGMKEMESMAWQKFAPGRTLVRTALDSLGSSMRTNTIYAISLVEMAKGFW